MVAISRTTQPQKLSPSISTRCCYHKVFTTNSFHYTVAISFAIRLNGLLHVDIALSESIVTNTVLI